MEMMIVQYDVTDAAIASLADKYTKLPEISDKEGYEFIRAGIADVRTLRTSVEKKRKELKADAIAWGKKVDGEAKRITGMLLEIESPMKAIKDDYDSKIKAEKEAKKKAEAERQSAIMKTINDMRQEIANCTGKSSEEIRVAIQAVMLIDTTQDFDEFEEAAAEVQTKTLEGLNDLLERTLDQEESDRLRKIEEEKLTKEREELDRLKQAEEERLAKERAAEEARVLEARKEEQRKQAEIQAKLDKQREELEAKQREIEAKERAEKEDAERKEVEKLTEEKRKADLEYLSECKKEAATALAGLSGSFDEAIAIINAIKNNEIPYVKFEI